VRCTSDGNLVVTGRLKEPLRRAPAQ
jgi:hypothetical protein